MCIFFTSDGKLVTSGRAAPPIHVADTRIFGRLTGPGSQLLVYDLTFGSAQDAAMVLPLPVATAHRQDAVRFIDFSRRAGFFGALSDYANFRDEEDIEMLSLDDLSGAPALPQRPPLPVREVGAYDASYVPSPGDFDRLDERFSIPPDLWSAQPQYAGYGFAVFRLRATAAAKGVHPMALEFRSSLERQVFFPTVHVHDGSFQPVAGFDHRLILQGGADTTNEEFKSFPQGGSVTISKSAFKVGPRFNGPLSREYWNWIASLPDADREALRAVLDGSVDEAVKRRAEEIQRTAPESPARPHTIRLMLRWAPFLDPAENLQSVRMVGRLPNVDTFFTVAPTELRPLGTTV